MCTPLTGIHSTPQSMHHHLQTKHLLCDALFLGHCCTSNFTATQTALLYHCLEFPLFASTWVCVRVRLCVCDHVRVCQPACLSDCLPACLVCQSVCPSGLTFSKGTALWMQIIPHTKRQVKQIMVRKKRSQCAKPSCLHSHSSVWLDL